MKSIRIVLTVFFAWSLLKGASLFFRRASADQFIFGWVGLGWLFWLLLSCSVAASAITLLYLWRPSVLAYRLAVTGVLLDLVLTAISAGIAMKNPGVAISAFVKSREERGLWVRPEVLELMRESPSVHVIPLITGIAIACVCFTLLYLLHRRTREAEQTLRAAPPWP